MSETEGSPALPDKGRSSTVGRLVRRSLMAPACVVIGCIVLSIGLYTPTEVVDAALSDAVVKGVQTAEQVKSIRAFYSDNVVSKTVKGGGKASPNYKSDPTAVPVPTTFILDLMAAFSTDQTKVALVSPYPWPMRQGRELDDFQQKAWETLSRDPTAHVSRRETIDGVEMLRVAVGDRMDASCVACHNSNPQSPKRDWKVGDVRGIIEVARPIDQITAGARQLGWRLVGGVAFGGVLLIAALLAIGSLLVKPLRDLAGVIDGMARGRVSERIPHTDRADELGTVARALENLQAETEERLRAESKIKHMAHHDVLTGLPNRARFANALRRSLMERSCEETIAVFCLDLDRFKAVNDTLGHAVGDELLKMVSDRLESCVPSGTLVARLGGDEFAVILRCEDIASTSGLAERIIAEISRPYDVQGYQLVVGVSIGIALAPEDGLDPDDLLKRADLALYRSKAEGRATHRFFEAAMDSMMQARRELELDLRRATAAGEFELHYQPLVNIESGRICGFEALLRWRHPERGLVPPGDFIALAEEIGEIEAIGAWVLREACRQASSWPSDVKIAVNLSSAQFRTGSLVLHVTTALAASCLAAERLELEITETLMLQDTAATLATLHQLRALGVRISMDDFGTGYSSLSYLRKFPFDKIKIDRSFIGDILERNESGAIVKAVMDLSAGLGMSTTAEGVETLAQFERLKQEGCREAQGYLISPPRPAAEIGAMLLERNGASSVPEARAA